ncbi:MAG TPA: hypothetical protein VKZ63_14590 [Kofleriaceae bacterium]|nr:hypothetical protein [Kofleriaceae bacterium]
MKAPTLARGLSVLSVAIAVWSLNVKWGEETAVRGGPPIHWERFVVGAALLCGLAAVLVWLATRPRGARWLRAAATAPALGAAAIAAYLRYRAAADDVPNLVAGPGWTWHAAGAALAVVAAVVTALATAPEAAAPTRRSPARRRGAGR